MPTQTQTPVQGYAHCIALKGTCPGYAQEPVDAFLVEVGRTYGDMGSADGGPLTNVIENSTTFAVFADEADRDCPHCMAAGRGSQPRVVTDQARKNYSEHVPGAEAEVKAQVSRDDEIAAMRAEMAVLREQVAARTGPEAA